MGTGERPCSEPDRPVTDDLTISPFPPLRSFLLWELVSSVRSYPPALAPLVHRISLRGRSRVAPVPRIGEMDASMLLLEGFVCSWLLR